MSNVTDTIRRAVIRDAVGRYRLRQCRPKTHIQTAVSQHVRDSNRKTVGDILNRLVYNRLLRDIVLGK
jgi:hypothetical protein